MAAVSRKAGASEWRTVRYVIVVHGIGEQRKYETLLPVVNRFAQARNHSRHRFGDPLTLGILASHLEDEEWIELEGIPCNQYGRNEVPFVGRRVPPDEHDRGKNVRFVDLHWGDIMEEHFDEVGESVDSWSRSLIDRLETRDAPKWIIEVLRNMRSGLIPLQQLLKLRLPGFSEKIFNAFLGDVQLYGEHAATRGKSIFRFHDTMARIHRKHKEDFESDWVLPRYTVIAHSLGTVMSFDALLLAHGATEGPSKGTEPPPLYLDEAIRDDLSEYGASGTRSPDLSWIRHVDSFVTLGSPIDKFLILWWVNYTRLRGEDWMNEELLEHRRRHPIRHYNYCDEQDPVGHELDVAYSTPPVKRVFGNAPREEVVFTRYSKPGVAHVDYWTDLPLFKRILDLVVDRRPLDKAHAVRWDSLGSYFGALCWSYLAIPLAGWVLSTALMIWAVNLSTRLSATGVLLGLTSVIVWLITAWFMKLMIQWRRAVLSKRKRSSRSLSRWKFVQRSLVGWLTFGLGTALFVLWVAALSIALPRLLSSLDRVLELLESLQLFDLLDDVGISLVPPDKERTLFSVLLGLALAAGLAIWNVIVFVWMKLRWSGLDLELDFLQYLETDRTDPDRQEQGAS